MRVPRFSISFDRSNNLLGVFSVRIYVLREILPEHFPSRVVNGIILSPKILSKLLMNIVFRKCLFTVLTSYIR